MVDAKLRRRFMFDAIPTNERTTLKDVNDPFNVVSSFIDVDDLVNKHRRDCLRDRGPEPVINDIDDTHNRVDRSIQRQFEYGMRYTKYPDHSEMNFNDVRPGGEWDQQPNMNKKIHDDIKNKRYMHGRVMIESNGAILGQSWNPFDARAAVRDSAKTFYKRMQPMQPEEYEQGPMKSIPDCGPALIGDQKFECSATDITRDAGPINNTLYSGTINNKQQLQYDTRFNINKVLGHRTTSLTTEHIRIRDYVADFRHENQAHNGQRTYVLETLSRVIQAHDHEFIKAMENDGKTTPSTITLQKITDIMQTAKLCDQLDGHSRSASLAQLNSKLNDFIYSNHRLQGRELTSLIRSILTTIKPSGGTNGINMTTKSKSHIDKRHRNIPIYNISKLQQYGTTSVKEQCDNVPNLMPFIITTKADEVDVTNKYDNSQRNYSAKITRTLRERQKGENITEDSF